MKLAIPLWLAAICLAFDATPAPAAELFAGAFAHDVNLGISVCCYEHGTDVQFGVRSNPIVSLHGFGDLRLYGMGLGEHGWGRGFRQRRIGVAAAPDGKALPPARARRGGAGWRRG